MNIQSVFKHKRNTNGCVHLLLEFLVNFDSKQYIQTYTMCVKCVFVKHIVSIRHFTLIRLKIIDERIRVDFCLLAYENIFPDYLEIFFDLCLIYTFGRR